MPKAVSFIIETLRENGYEAFAVGGCVRDSILKKEPKDWDITTSAKPEETKALFKKTIDTGIKHGTVTVMVKGEGYEVTTYRVDGEYEDGRHPKEVTFTANLKEDLKRRDFTINAMAYNEYDGIEDCFGGIKDLENHIIRCVGDPMERFSEDALRMLRAIRFSAVLGFEIEKNTEEAIKKLAPTIKKISRERIQVELDKLLMSNNPDRVIKLQESGLLKYIFETACTKENIETMSKYLSNSEKNHYIRWAIFVMCLNKEDVLKSLKFDNATIKISNLLAKEKDRKLEATEKKVRHDIVDIGREYFRAYYLSFRRCIQNMPPEEIDEIEKICEIIEERKDALSLKELEISGKEMSEFGIEPGKEMGELLNELLEMVLDDHTKNKKEILVEYIKSKS